MADIVPSLFGLTPEMYQQRQAQQADAAALQYAQLTPLQQANFAIGRGAYQLAGALGGQDPQLQLISNRNAIARQIDYNNPESMMEGVNALTQAGDTVGAMQLADVARKMQSEMAQRTQRLAAAQASMAQATRERVQTTPADIAKATRVGEIAVKLRNPEITADERAGLEAELVTLRPERATPEAIAKAARVGELTTQLQNPNLDAPTRASLEAQLASLKPERTTAETATVALAGAIEGADAAVEALKLQPPGPERDAALRRATTRLEALRAQLPRGEKLPSVGGDREAVALEAFNKPFAELTPEQRATVNKRVEDEQKRKATAGAPRISVSSQSLQENEFSKQLGTAQGKRYQGALDLRDNAVSAINTFQQLSKLDDQGLISGTFATGRVGATNLLNTLGLIAPEMSERLARSENYQKIAGDAILATLGGKLGAGFSNEDRKFIQSLVPQLENSSAARRQLIDYMIRKNTALVSETTRLIDFAESRRTLNGFVPNIPLPSPSGAPAAGGNWSIRPVNK